MKISASLFGLEESASTSSDSVNHVVKELLGRYRTLLAEEEGSEAPTVSMPISATSPEDHPLREELPAITPVHTKVDLEPEPLELEKQ